MKLRDKIILITGAAGFIGSHLVDRFMVSKNFVRGIDNLSTGRLENIKHWLKDPNFSFIQGDILNEKILEKVVDGSEVIFHLAANPDIRTSTRSPGIHFEHNVVGTYKVLEAVRKSKTVKMFILASTSSVYGDAEVVPTPEGYGPIMPISVYGSSKVAAEALTAAYAPTFGFRSIIFRFANIIGPRMKSGVVYDLIVKLMSNPRELEILGDGTQTKSYLLVDDLIDGMLVAIKELHNQVNIINIGSDDHLKVMDVAKIVVEEMGIKDVKFKFTGGVNGGRGWKGDIKNECLDVSKIKSLGWKPKHTCEESIRIVVKALQEEIVSNKLLGHT